MTNNSRTIALGEKIKALRKGLGWTQQELAASSGLSRVYIGQIERGEVNPSIDKVNLIAAAMGYCINVCFEKK